MAPKTAYALTEEGRNAVATIAHRYNRHARSSRASQRFFIRRIAPATHHTSYIIRRTFGGTKVCMECDDNTKQTSALKPFGQMSPSEKEKAVRIVHQAPQFRRSR